MYAAEYKWDRACNCNCNTKHGQLSYQLVSNDYPGPKAGPPVDHHHQAGKAGQGPP